MQVWVVKDMFPVYMSTKLKTIGRGFAPTENLTNVTAKTETSARAQTAHDSNSPLRGETSAKCPEFCARVKGVSDCTLFIIHDQTCYL